MEDSTRKTLYREDSLGGQQNRVRPRGYSFYDLIEQEEQEEQQHKLARTRVQQDLRHKAISQGFQFLEGVQSEESLAFSKFVAGVGDTSTSRAGDSGLDFDRNDSLETQPSLNSALTLELNKSFKFKGNLVDDEEASSPHLFENFQGKAPGSGRAPAGEDLEDEDGADQQENEVIKFEERAPPIAEEEAGESDHVDVVLVVNATGYVTVHFDVCLPSSSSSGQKGRQQATGSGSQADFPGASDAPGGQRKAKKKRKKKVAPKQQPEERPSWNGSNSSGEPPTSTGRLTPTKAHKVFDADKKLSYNKKKELLLAHLRAVNSKKKENDNQPASPNPQTKNLWTKAVRKASVGAAINDSYLAALDSAKRHKQLSTKRLTPESGEKKRSPRAVIDAKSDYGKRHGRVSPKSTRRRKPQAKEEPAEMVSLTLTEIISTPVTAVRAINRFQSFKSSSSGKKKEVRKEWGAAVPKPKTSAATPRSPSSASPPPVQMSFKLEDITSTVTKVKAINKFRSFKSSSRHSPRAAAEEQETPPATTAVSESQQGASKDIVVEGPGEDHGTATTGGEPLRNKEEEESHGGVAGGEGNSSRSPGPAEERDHEPEPGEPECREPAQQIPAAESRSGRGTGKEAQEITPATRPAASGSGSQDDSMGVHEVDPKIVDYFMQINDEEDAKDGKKSKKKSKKKKSKIKKLFGKILCRSKNKV
ncbi:hypothetical protein HOP50_03g20870 [Chloropicon primus]|uniref:Uncharacterized protein n=1 Tax=Chloropicon primus TaxID=1764295 RepID=A0A5B8MGL2_9CHLO|nr:hypothetical protein A3770_03p20870 [Chloropicon primus]UPQ98781.1 hypothetical protein HOP50_03g20870 [Chloropicon primus]|eukprot:QDZ19569.1 hypothetical protein A3770_03p20870 [Chloropicon primus]